MDLKKILVPTDFSPTARAAIAPARTLAERFGAQVDLIHVYEAPPLLPLASSEWMVPGPSGEQVPPRLLLKSFATQEMDKLLAELRGTGMTVHGRVEEGSAWRAINQVVERERYDLIVIASHGRAGLERAIMGSTAEKVVRHAPCPVLVVRAEPGAAAV